MEGVLRILAALLACLLPLSCELPVEDRSWTVVSWNLQNLFDDVDDGTEYSEFDPENGIWDERLYQRRLDRVAEVSSAAISGHPDLCVFQELEKGEILEDLVSGPLKFAGYRYMLAVPGFSIIRCGILSRYPIHSVSVRDCGSYGVRPLRPALSFIVESPGGPVAVIAVHWKSPRDGRAATESARYTEAAVAEELAMGFLERYPAMAVMIIGDLNTPGDGAYRPAALAPWYPDADMSRDTASLLRADSPEGAAIRQGRPVFFDPDPNPSEGAPGSYWYAGDWDRPDRALLSAGLVDGTGLEFSSCRAGGTGVMEDSLGRPIPWRTDEERGYSDHLPLILEFSFIEN